MNKIDKIIIKYAIFSFPLIVLLMLWSLNSNSDELANAEGVLGFFWNTLGWIFLAWIVSSLYIICKMVAIRNFRDTILKNVSGIKERDERESSISGEAAKFSFLSTAAFLLFLLFLSLFTITVQKYPKELQKPGHTGSITVGLNIKSFMNDHPQKKVTNEGLLIFTYNGIPISSTMLILLVLLWQIGSYQYLSRRILKE